MALEQVLSDQDSEDEVDDDVADFEDRRVCSMLNYVSVIYFCQFVDVKFLIVIVVEMKIFL